MLEPEFQGGAEVQQDLYPRTGNRGLLNPFFCTADLSLASSLPSPPISCAFKVLFSSVKILSPACFPLQKTPRAPGRQPTSLSQVTKEPSTAMSRVATAPLVSVCPDPHGTDCFCVSHPFVHLSVLSVFTAASPQKSSVRIQHFPLLSPVPRAGPGAHSLPASDRSCKDPCPRFTISLVSSQAVSCPGFLTVQGSWETLSFPGQRLSPGCQLLPLRSLN